MEPRTTRRTLIAATAAVAAVLITAVTMLASQRGEPEVITAPVTPQPAAAAKSKPAEGEIVWHAEPAAGPATVFNDEAGAALTLQSFAGQVLVVNLWATWCAPCIEELPTLDALQGKLGGDAFRVLVIAQDREGLKVVKPFADKVAWKHLAIHLEPQNRFARDARLRGLPTTLIIDRQGREVGRLEGTIDWASDAVVAKLKDLIARPM